MFQRERTLAGALLIICQGLVYLHGVTEYGDAVEDEWLIVHLLRQLTIAYPNAWARVFDTDGEFLLVEAANVLPKWLSPEIDHNRVWIHGGKLFIVPCKDGADSAARHLSLPDAVEYIKENREALVHSSFIEAEAFYRLEKYPTQVADSIHHSLITIPRRLAYVLRTVPKSVAPAVEAFYLRDALALKPILSSSSALAFPPKDLVTVSVRFSKVLFAQLRSQRFETPPRWKSLLSKGSPDVSDTTRGDVATQRLEAGMKLTCGFEMLAAKAERSKSRTVRELAIIIEDLNEDGDEVLPSDADIQSWPDVDRNDSESWLDINYEDFERELDGKRSTGSKKEAKEGFGDANAQENLRKIVSRFEAFLNDEQAGPEGVEFDEMDFDDDDDDDSGMEEDSDAEDKEVSFDEEEFARMMREMMCLPSTTAPDHKPVDIKGKGKPGAQKDILTRPEEEDEDEEIQKLASQMENELNQHGALALDPPSKKKPMLKAESKSGSQAKSGKGDAEDADEDSEEQVDVDYNLAKNILESFKSQGGMSGPTGNLLGMLGLNLPRDEDNGEDDDLRGSSGQDK